jgi:hexulose-6-phosphate isomerase
MKKSIGDNIFPKGLPFDQGLALLEKAGYDGIETSDTDLRALQRQIRDVGLQVSDIANSLDWKQNVSARNPAEREAAFRHIERQIEAAQIFGCDAILVVAGLVTSKAPYDGVYDRTVDSLQKLSRKAAAARVRIGVENCCSEQKFLLSPREFNTFLNDVNSPWVGIHLDVGNIHDTGFAEQWIQILGPRITCVHLKDVLTHRGRCGDQSVYTNIFLGDNDWPAIRAAFEKVQYNGWLIAEMEARYRFAPDQQIFDTAAALNRLIEGRL